MKTSLSFALIAATLTLVGCDSSGPASTTVAIGFRMETGSASQAKTAFNSLEVAGSNGILRIEDVRLIAEEFKLKRLSDDDCDVLTGVDHENCEEFALPPFFVDLPLDETRVEIAAGVVPPDTYRELEFEIENLDDDDQNSNAAAAAALLEEIRLDFPDWPRKASILLVGEFEGPDETARPFRVYVDAEIEIEMGLNPPLTIENDGTSQDITIVVDPSVWLRRSDSTVLDLTGADFGNTGGLFEFEVEIENGFKEIEFGS